MPVTNDQAAADRINAMTPQQHKTHEDRLRRMAKRQGLMLLKSRRRDPRAFGYDGYMLVDCADSHAGHVIAGSSPGDFSMSIDEVEAFLTGDKV